MATVEDLGLGYLPSDLLTAVKSGRRLEAMNIYKEWSGCDFTTAAAFIGDLFAQLGEPPKAAPPPPSDRELPKEALLLKLLNMTTSDNDNIATISIRKANALLESAGWTWEKLLAGKIVVVEDPFARIAEPTNRAPRRDSPMAPPPPRTPPPPRQASPPKHAQTYPKPGASSDPSDAWNAVHGRRQAYSKPNPQQTPRPSAAPTNPAWPSASGRTKTISDRTNQYAGPCYICGDDVEASAGYVFQPVLFNVKAPNKWLSLCCDCNKKVNESVPLRAAPRTFLPQGSSSSPWTAKPSVNSL